MRVLVLPSQEVLISTFGYDPETGKLWWLKTGNLAFYSENTNGHLQGKYKGVAYLSHRIIWKMMTGEEPEFIDHDNRIRSDNRWVNLFSVSQSRNSKNTKKRQDNRTGHVGVYWNKREKRWKAAIGHERNFVHLGTFTSMEAAIQARKSAERDYQFHPNHGRG